MELKTGDWLVVEAVNGKRYQGYLRRADGGVLQLQDEYDNWISVSDRFTVAWWVGGPDDQY